MTGWPWDPMGAWVAAGCAAGVVLGSGPGSASVSRRLVRLPGVRPNGPPPVRRQRRRGERPRRWPRSPRGGTALAGGAAELPLLVDLLAAVMAAGANVPDAVAVVAAALDSSPARRVAAAGTALSLGAAPETAWATLSADPALRPLARALTRAAVSGAPTSDLLAEVAADLRARHRLSATRAARVAGVRAVAPLGLCFLPAFVLLGVVPTVVGLAGAALSGR